MSTAWEVRASMWSAIRDVVNVHRAAPPVTIASRDTPLPLSFTQQRLWSFLRQFEPGGLGYNICSAHRLAGSFEYKILARSLNEVVRRHEALRTTFEHDRGVPFQVISSDLALDLSITDLGEVPAAERENEVRRFAAKEATRPFDLTEGPLLRAHLLRLAEDDHLLLLTLHHIISDGWSMNILLRDLSVCYSALHEGRRPVLPDLRVQFADFAVWQREWLQGETLKRRLSYWEQLLDNDVRELVSSGRPKCVARDFDGTRRHFEVPPSLSKALRRVSRQHEVTLFITLLAAFYVLLLSRDGQAHMLLGAPVANRNSRELKDLVGYFSNVLPLVTDLSGNPTFSEVVRRVRDVVWGFYAHQDVPFEKIAAELHLPAGLHSNTPLFERMFALRNFPPTSLQLAGVNVAPVDIEATTTDFDLALSMLDTKHGLRGRFEYSTAVFDEDAIELVLERFRNLLVAVAAEPGRFVSSL